MPRDFDARINAILGELGIDVEIALRCNWPW
jgi:hypothetical protein